MKNHNLSVVISFMGVDGSGKSTLIDILTGLLKPSSGEIKLDDQNVNLMQKKWYAGIGYVPQFIFLTDDTIKKNIAFGVKEEEINVHLLKKSIQIAELKFFSEPEKETNKYFGSTPFEIISEIDDLITFLITSFGFLKFKKCIFSLYVSIVATNEFFLSKKTSSFKFKAALFFLEILEK